MEAKMSSPLCEQLCRQFSIDEHEVDKESRVAALEHEFTNLTLGAFSSMDEYCEKFKDIADKLSNSSQRQTHATVYKTPGLATPNDPDHPQYYPPQQYQYDLNSNRAHGHGNQWHGQSRGRAIPGNNLFSAQPWWQNYSGNQLTQPPTLYPSQSWAPLYGPNQGAVAAHATIFQHPFEPAQPTTVQYQPQPKIYVVQQAQFGSTVSATDIGTTFNNRKRNYQDPTWYMDTEDSSHHTADPGQTKSMSKEHSDDQHEASSAGEIHILGPNLKKFFFDDLKMATRNFRHDMKLGGGEFWEVFEGSIECGEFCEGEFGPRYFKLYAPSWFAVNSRRRIAIKKFHQYKIQHSLKENDIIKSVDMRFLSRINHPNLVKVLGYCFEDKNMFLVYEFMENGSLDSHLFKKNKVPLSWKTRVQIAIGIAEALLFLHTTQNQVDNFSIKIHQILLDKNYNAKVSDFESAKIVYGDSFNDIQQCKNSEYEGIVRSFGVLLIQIITCERISNIGVANLRQHMWNPNGEIRKESLRRALDPRLLNVDDTTLMEAMKLALDCVANPSFPLKKALDVLTQIYTHLIKS